MDHASACADFALGLIEVMKSINANIDSYDDDIKPILPIDIRIGIATGGPLISGIINNLNINKKKGVIGKERLQHDLWGDTVNLSSRMESSSVPGRINVSKPTYDLISTKFFFILIV
jgi:adenylate cyclase